MSENKDEKKLEFDITNCWKAYRSEEHRTAMDELADRYMDFISTCKTEREVVEYVLRRAGEAGFGQDMSGDRVVVPFRGKTVFLARKGKRPLKEGFRLIGAHGDAPRLDLKQHPLSEDCHVSQAKTHYYGGIRKYHWLATPLALHGVVMAKNGETVRIVLGEDPSEPVFAVPDLLPHLAQKQATQKVNSAFDPNKLNLLMGHSPVLGDEADTGDEGGDNGGNNGGKEPKQPVKARVLEMLNERFGIDEEDLYTAELQAVPAGPARYIGLDGALMGGYAHDDRICVFSAFEALLAEEQPEFTEIALFWDKEEIGSDGSTGAKSLFLEYTLEDLIDAWEPDTKIRHVFLNGKAISADVHAAVDPDYQDVHEKTNSAFIGHGPCFCKFTGHGGKYGANDAHAEYVGWLRNVMNEAEVPWQMAELGKVDQGGGGTVAKYLAAYGMDIIDMGPAVLSMHSPFEVASKADLYATVLAFRAFFRSGS